MKKIKRKDKKKMKRCMKLTGILTVAAMMLASVPSATATEGKETMIVKQWSFESDAEGWRIGQLSDETGTKIDTMANLRVVDGTLRADAIVGNGDPQFVSGDLSNEDITLGDGSDGKANYIKIRMKNHTDIADEGKVFFMTDGDGNYSSEKAYSFPINKNQSGFTDIYLKMSDVSGWSGKLKALRIDPVDKFNMDTTNGGTFIIDDVSLYAIPEPEKKTVVNQTFDTVYKEERTGGDWRAAYLKDSSDTMMARASHSSTGWEQTDGALKIKFTSGDQRVDVLGFAGDKGTTGTHRISVRIKNNGSAVASVHLNALGAVDSNGKAYGNLMNQKVDVGGERVITFERDFYTPTTETNGLLIQSANACDITVDDVKIIKEDKLALSPLSQIHEGAENLDISGAYGLLFNYNVKGGHSQYTHLGLNGSGQANIKIYEDGVSDAVVSVAYAVGSQTYAQFCIPSAKHLKYNTKYKLVLDVVNAKDNSQSLKNLSVNFKTKEEPKMMGVGSDGVETTVLNKIEKIKYCALGKGYMAAYKDGKLSDVKLTDVSAENTLSLDGVDIEGADIVKAFLWTDELTPITSELVLK